MIADLNGLDPIGMLSVRALPERFQIGAVPTTSAAQAQFVLDFVEWPVAKRYFPDGTSGVERGNHYVEGSALDALQRIRFAELGKLFPLRDGGIGWYDRDGPAPPAPSAIINCGGVGLTDMWQVMGLGRLRNRVVIGGGYGVFGTVRPPDEYRSVTTSVGVPRARRRRLADRHPADGPLGGDDPRRARPAAGPDDAGHDPAGGPEVKQVVMRGVRCALDGRRTRASPTRWSRCSDSVSPRPGHARSDGRHRGHLHSRSLRPRTATASGSGALMSTATHLRERARGVRRGDDPPGRRGTAILRRAVVLGRPASGVGSRSCGSTPARSRSARRSWRRPSPGCSIPTGTASPRRRPSGTHFDMELRSGYALAAHARGGRLAPGREHRGDLPAARIGQHGARPKGLVRDVRGCGLGARGRDREGRRDAAVARVEPGPSAGTAPTSTTVFEDGYLDVPRLRVTYTPAVSDPLVVIVVAIIAATIAGLELIRSKGQEALAWAVLLLSLAVLIDRL